MTTNIDPQVKMSGDRVLDTLMARHIVALGLGKVDSISGITTLDLGSSVLQMAFNSIGLRGRTGSESDWLAPNQSFDQTPVDVLMDHADASVLPTRNWTEAN